MEKLRWQYVKDITSIAVFSVGIIYFLDSTFGKPVPRYLYSLIIFLAIWLYNKCLWKIVSPRQNFSGKWWGYTNYTCLQRHVVKTESELPTTRQHDIAINQSPFEIRIESSEGAGMVYWKSESMQLEGNTIKMSYLVTRKQDDIQLGFPKITKGIEELEVVEINFWGMPTRMKGTFHHAALDQCNLYSGETEYFKKRKKNAIQKEPK